MLVLLLGILSVFQPAAKFNYSPNRRSEELKFRSATTVYLSVTTISSAESSDNEQENNVNSHDASIFNSDYKNYLIPVVKHNGNGGKVLSNCFLSPLLLDIPPPDYC